jgi:hypothetical protein
MADEPENTIMGFTLEVQVFDQRHPEGARNIMIEADYHTPGFGEMCKIIQDMVNVAAEAEHQRRKEHRRQEFERLKEEFG